MKSELIIQQVGKPEDVKFIPDYDEAIVGFMRIDKAKGDDKEIIKVVYSVERIIEKMKLERKCSEDEAYDYLAIFLSKLFNQCLPDNNEPVLIYTGKPEFKQKKLMQIFAKHQAKTPSDIKKMADDIIREMQS